MEHYFVDINELIEQARLIPDFCNWEASVTDLRMAIKACTKYTVENGVLVTVQETTRQ